MKHQTNTQFGFSLLEITIATAILSMGLGGLSLLLLTAVMGTAEAGHHTLASTKASSLAEMIILTSDAAGHYVAPLPPTGDSCANGGICSEEQAASNELAAWQQEVADVLPAGSGLVCRDSTPDDGHSDDDSCDGEGSLVVKVFWLEQRQLNDEDGGLRRMVARLPFGISEP